MKRFNGQNSDPDLRLPVYLRETALKGTDLSIKTGRHGHDVSRLTVDGEHVRYGAVRRLGQDSIAHHSIGRCVVVGVKGRNVHHISPW